MATTAYVIWERNAKNVVQAGGAALVFPTANDASAWLKRLAQHGADNQKPKPSFDIVTVTV
jgi:hypothetical protein